MISIDNYCMKMNMKPVHIRLVVTYYLGENHCGHCMLAIDLSGARRQICAIMCHL